MDDDLLLRVANSVFISGTHVSGCTTSVAESTRMCRVGGGKLVAVQSEAPSMILYKRVSQTNNRIYPIISGTLV